MKYIFSVFCVLFGLTSSWADSTNVEYDTYTKAAETLSQESFLELCRTKTLLEDEYLSCDSIDYEGYKCQTAGDFVRIVAYDNLECGIVEKCEESLGDYSITYSEDSEFTDVGNGSSVGLFGCFCEGTSCKWDILYEAKEQGDCTPCCAEGETNECYEIQVGGYDYKYYGWDGYLYKEKCLPEEQVVVDATVGDGASATVVDGGASAATGTPEVVVGANVVVNASEIVEKLKPYNLLKRSAWVNKDGKFNTTRLLVDTGAGAVLGTVGGVIANKVIRKNQISSGMDGYQCVVNGQTVAEYGDDFVIDIYR